MSIRTLRSSLALAFDEVTFKAAQAIKLDRRRDATPVTAQKARAPKRAFSGLLKCGC